MLFVFQSTWKVSFPSPLTSAFVGVVFLLVNKSSLFLVFSFARSPFLFWFSSRCKILRLRSLYRLIDEPKHPPYTIRCGKFARVIYYLHVSVSLWLFKTAHIWAEIIYECDALSRNGLVIQNNFWPSAEQIPILYTHHTKKLYTLTDVGINITLASTEKYTKHSS